jgi:phage shock protein PspC (stress-responsive transcriptional regulator)
MSGRASNTRKTLKMTRTFKRMVEDRDWIGGVCSGMAYWLGLPVAVVRLVWAIAFFSFGVGFWPYMLLCIFVPRWAKEPADYAEVTSDT